MSVKDACSSAFLIPILNAKTMAEKKCCVENCNSSTWRQEDIGVTYHKFPKDPVLCNIWIHITHTTPNSVNSAYVCSRHFCKSDFEIYQESKYVLKSGAIPTIFAWTMAESTKTTNTNAEDIFDNDHDDKINTSNSSKESEPENLDSIKKFIEDQQHKSSQNMHSLDSDNFGNLSVTALDVIHRSQEVPIAVGTSVMNMILSESEVEVTNKNEKVEEKYTMSAGERGAVALSVGSKVEAKDFSNQWYIATIVEVDYDEIEVLVHCEDSNRHDEWISVNSSRLRPYNPNRVPKVTPLEMAPTSVNTEAPNNYENKSEEKKKVTFAVGERCLARWRDNRRFMATVQSDLGTGQYEVIFDDGFHWKCSTSRLSKLKYSSEKSFDMLSEDISTSTNTSALSPVPSGSGPLGTSSPLNIPLYHTHLFDPTRDYLGSKSERREMKRKLNIKEIFNIGQKKRKIKTPEGGAQKEKKPKIARKKVKRVPKHIAGVKKEIPDAVASIIGTIDDMEIKTEIYEDKSVADEGSDKITLDDLIDTTHAQTSRISEMSDSSDPNNSTDPVTKEEEILEKFDKPDESKHEEVIDKMKEVISKLEDGLTQAEEVDRKVTCKLEDVLIKTEKIERKESPTPELNLEVIQVNPNDMEMDLEIDESPKEGLKDGDVELDIKEAPKLTKLWEATINNLEDVKIEEKPKKALSKVKKNKKLRLLQEKKVKKQVERVKNELEEMKKQVEEMRQQMLQKTEELAAQQRVPQEMPESFLLPGEWCCRWVNGEPVGEVHETEADPKFDANHKPALPRRTVLVEDKRLPEGWRKIMVRRSLGQSAGKWDVVLLSPDNKRFHTKNEMRNYLDQTKGELKSFENALLDFGVHLKLSRRMGWVSNTGTRNAPVSNTSPFMKRKKLSLKKDAKRLKIRKPNYIIQRDGVPGTSGDSEVMADTEVVADTDTQNPPIEDGYVCVGSLKVQVIDNLLRCPAEGCLKNFRNHTLLKMHIKHYHRDLKKMLGTTPKVVDLAYARARPVAGGKIRKPKNNRVIKVKIPRPPKPQAMAEAKPVIREPQPELRVNLTPLPPDNLPQLDDSPKLRQALIPKPVKRPKVLLPVRRPDPEPVLKHIEEEVDVADDVPPVELAECVDYETSISTHTVTKPIDFKHKKRKFPKVTVSEDDEWLTMNSDVETRSSFPGSGTPDSKTMDKMATPNLAASSESNEGEHKEGEMYMFTESGERIKIERMKREEIINCHCGFREEDGLMVQCELCLCWQHALCHNIQKESEVPEKYTCSICLNPKRGRRSKRFLHDQDRLYEGLLPGAKPCELLRRSHELSGNLLRIQDALHAMRVKYYVATKKDHPKLYLWAKDWENAELNFAQERLNSDYSDLNIIINNIGKENLPVKPGAGVPGAPGVPGGPGIPGGPGCPGGADDRDPALLGLPGVVPLDFPITTSDLERMAKSIQEQETRVSAPQPEAAIENSACRERLLRHVQRCQALLDARLDSIEAQVAELESQDPSFEDDETADYFPRTKQTIQMLMRDLETMEELGVIT